VAVIYREDAGERSHPQYDLLSMVSFIGILFVGYIYALKKRAFDWTR